MRDEADPITAPRATPADGLDAGRPVLSSVETTRFTAEQWKSRALYEEACKLAAERALARAMEVIRDALFAAAHVRAELDDAERTVGLTAVEGRAGSDSGTMA